MDHNLDKEKSAQYALGSLDESEARDLEARLADDPELAAELEKWRETTALMSYAAPAAEPSPDVRSRILEKIKQTPQTPPSAPRKFTLIEGKAAPKNVVAPTAAMTDSSFARRSRWSLLPGVAAIAATIVALVLAFSLYRALQNNESKDNQIAELNQRLTNAEQKVSETQRQLERKWQERELLNSPNAVEVVLKGTENSPDAKARLIVDRETGRAMFFVEGLPPAPDNKAYQFWFISDPKNPFPGAVFSTNESGKAILRDNMPAKTLKASTFAITLEPQDGSPAPTTKPYLIGSPL